MGRGNKQSFLRKLGAWGWGGEGKVKVEKKGRRGGGGELAGVG